MSSLLQDFRHAFRVLLKAPAFSLAVVLVLALGIGANTAIFSVVNAVLLRPLPFPEPGRLMQVWHVPPAKQFPSVTWFSVSPANYLDWERQNHVFQAMAIYGFASFNVTGGDQPQTLKAARVSPNFYSVLGLRPVLGRTFTPGEDQPGRNHVVILGQALWKSQFGGDSKIVGRSITLEGEPYTVVGVMDAKFRFPGWAQLWTPMAWTDQQRAVRDNHNYSVIARLKPGITLPQAQAEMDTISRRLQQQYPAEDAGWGATIVPLHEQLVGDVRPALLMLLGAVALVLLIACANVANLVLAKTLARKKEMAIRAALGASRARVLQQVLAETVLLALGGGALGLLAASFLVDLIVRFLASQLPRMLEIRLDGWVLAFALVISVLTGIVAGLAPALRSMKTDLNEALKQGLGRTDADSSGKRTRSILVGCEVALSLMLLIGAGLLIRSLWALRSTDPGFDARQVLTMTLPTPAVRYPTLERDLAFLEQVRQRVRTLPGVDAAGFVDDLPLSGSGSMQPVQLEGRPTLPMAEQPEVAVRVISAGYLEAMRIPLVRGRLLNDADVAGRPAAVVISDSMAKRFWPHEDALGKRLTMYFFPEVTREVVGVVGDVRMNGLDVSQPDPTLYMPLTQFTLPPGFHFTGLTFSMAVRSASRAEDMTSAVVSAIHQIDSQQPVVDIATMQNVVADTLSQRRLNMLLLAAFAGLALLLAAVGIYSVLAYSVRRRVREIGIRMALGAQISDVLRMIVIDGMRPTFFGLAAGLAGALALGRLLAGLLYGVGAADPATFAAASVVLLGAGVLASIIPAYRATKVDPMRTLRDE